MASPWRLAEQDSSQAAGTDDAGAVEVVNDDT